MSLSQGDRKNRDPALPVYPPRDHILRDIPFVLERRGTQHRSRQQLTGLNLHRPSIDHRHVNDGRDHGDLESVVIDDFHVGVWCAVIDLLAGTLCGITIAPDWMATSSLTFHRYGLDSDNQRREFKSEEWELCNDASILRNGRSGVTLSIESTLQSNAGEEVVALGSATATFVRLSRPVDDIDLTKMRSVDDTVIEFERLDTMPVSTNIVDALSIEIVNAAAGELQIPMTDYVRNSFGALNGGVIAICVTTAAKIAVNAQRSASAQEEESTLLGNVRPMSDVEIHYVAQARVGPYQTRARVLGGTTATFGSLVQVQLFDLGQRRDGQPVVVTHATVRVW